MIEKAYRYEDIRKGNYVMPKQRRPRQRLSTNLRELSLDFDLFTKLYLLYYDVACDSNTTQVSRTLGISRRKADELFNRCRKGLAVKDHIKGIWWNDALKTLLMDQSSFLLAHGNKKYRERGHEIRSQMKGQRLLGYADDHSSHSIGDEDIDPETEAHQWVLAYLAQSDNHMLTLDQLSRRTGFNKRVVRAAAERLGLLRKSVGFGEDKKAYYAIPHPEDL